MFELALVLVGLGVGGILTCCVKKIGLSANASYAMTETNELPIIKQDISNDQKTKIKDQQENNLISIKVDSLENKQYPFESTKEKMKELRSPKQKKSSNTVTKKIKGLGRDLLDLHGLNRKQALESVKTFLKDKLNASLKIVKIITGKGKHSKNGMPILKPLVLKYLNELNFVNIFFVNPKNSGEIIVNILQPEGSAHIIDEVSKPKNSHLNKIISGPAKILPLNSLPPKQKLDNLSIVKPKLDAFAKSTSKNDFNINNNKTSIFEVSTPETTTRPLRPPLLRQYHMTSTHETMTRPLRPPLIGQYVSASKCNKPLETHINIGGNCIAR